LNFFQILSTFIFNFYFHWRELFYQLIVFLAIVALICAMLVILWCCSSRIWRFITGYSNFNVA